MSQKRYINAQGFLEDAFQLGLKVIESGFYPTSMISLWRGATPIALAVNAVLNYSGIRPQCYIIRTSSYNSGIDERKTQVRVDGLEAVLGSLGIDERILIVDDVFDTGRSVQAVMQQLRSNLGAKPEIRVAVPYFKPTRNKTSFSPDYFIHETSQWIKFPHSLEGLTQDEIKQHRPEIYQVLYE